MAWEPFDEILFLFRIIEMTGTKKKIQGHINGSIPAMVPGDQQAIFSKGQSKKKEKEEVDFAQLFEKIGRLETENDWLKKNWNAELGRKTADD